jgi:hypothetical protein
VGGDRRHDGASTGLAFGRRSVTMVGRHSHVRGTHGTLPNLCAVVCLKYRDSVGSALVPEEVYLLCRRCMIPQYAQVASVGRRSNLRSSEPWEIEALA